MELIRSFLYNWYPDYYSEHFTMKDTIELFELVCETTTTETDTYNLESSRFREDFETALEEYMTI